MTKEEKLKKLKELQRKLKNNIPTTKIEVKRERESKTKKLWEEYRMK